MWEMMTRVADSFYIWGEEAIEVVRVLFAWVIMMGPILFCLGLVIILVLMLLSVIFEKVLDVMIKRMENRETQ